MRSEAFQKVYRESQAYGSWCSEDKAWALWTFFKEARSPNVVEIGVFLGQSAFICMSAMRHFKCGGHFWAIDAWNTAATLEGINSPANAEWWSALDFEDIYQRFQANVEKNNFRDICTVIRATSAGANESFVEKIDLLHIDANHSAVKSCEDVRLWMPLVKDGALVFMDDTDWEGTLEAQTLLQHQCAPHQQFSNFKTYRKGAPSGATLTLAYVTAKADPLFNLFIESITPQLERFPHINYDIVVVDLALESYDYRRSVLRDAVGGRFEYRHVSPKASPWQGRHRVTQTDFFCASNARNTALIYAKGSHIACIDDASVLGPQWLEYVVRSMEEEKIFLGSYKKVEAPRLQLNKGGIIPDTYKLEELDTRWHLGTKDVVTVVGSCFFGASFAMPLEKALEVNGFDEYCDGVGGEDYDFGIRLERAGHSLYYARNMTSIESSSHHQAPHTSVCVRRSKVCYNGEWIDWYLRNQLEVRDPTRILPLSNKYTNLKKMRTYAAEGRALPNPYLGFKNDWADGEPLVNMGPPSRIANTTRTVKKRNQRVLDPHTPIMFCHIPKTAGFSLRTTLGQKLGAISPKVGLDSGRFLISSHHLMSSRREDLGEWFNKAFKFTIVRNPYERFISTFFFLISENADSPFYKGNKALRDKLANEFNNDFTKFALGGNYVDVLNTSMFSPQYIFLQDPLAVTAQPYLEYEPMGLVYPKKLLIDYIAKYEYLEADLQILCTQYFNIPYEPLPRLNTTPNKPKSRDLLTPQIKDSLYAYYAHDFNLFHYEK